MRTVSNHSQSNHDWVKIEASASSAGVRFRAYNGGSHLSSIIKSDLLIEKSGHIKCYLPTLMCIGEGIKSSGSDNVTILKDEGLVKLISGDACFDIGCGNIADFPEIPTFEAEHEFSVPCEEFKSSVKRVLSVQGKEMPYVGVDISNKMMTMWSTDSVRLVKDSVQIASDIEAKFFLSHPTIKHMMMLANSKDGNLLIGWNGRDCQMKFDSTKLTFGIEENTGATAMLLLDVLRAHPIEIKMDTTKIRSVLSTFEFFAEGSDGQRAPHMVFNISKDSAKVTIDNKSQGKGCATWKLPCVMIGSDSIEIKLNPRHMYGFTNGLLGSSMVMRIKDAKSAIYMKFDGLEEALVDTDRLRRVGSDHLECALSPIWL